jgi:hypothetical protein
VQATEPWTLLYLPAAHVVEASRLAAREVTAHEESGTYSWNGRIHRVPMNYKFTSGCTKSLFDNWWVTEHNACLIDGTPIVVKCGLKDVEPYSLTKVSDRTLLSKARRVISYIIKIAIQRELATADPTPSDRKAPCDYKNESIANKTVEERNDLFKECFEELTAPLHNIHATRRHNISYVTKYDQILLSQPPTRENRKRLRSEISTATSTI